MAAGLALGCATWVPSQGVVTAAGVDAELPAGWMRLNESSEILATRDGVRLEHIRIFRVELDEEVPNTERSLEPDMLPEDLADLWLDSLRLGLAHTNLRVLENAPARLDGQDCYKLYYSSLFRSSLEVRTVEYGCLVGEHFYRIRYRAASQHYFDSYLGDFERVVGGVRFAG